MKIRDIPKSGKCGLVVAFQSRYGLCLREWLSPHNTITPARQFMRRAFGHHSQAFSHKLSQEQMDRWRVAGGQVMSDPRLGQCGPLTGQQLYTSINSVRSCVKLPETLEVPVRPVFSANPVGKLVISNTEQGVRLAVPVTGELTEDVMVFGQEPCSAGRSKRRSVAYLGLLSQPVNGLSDFTLLYKARFGEPRPGTKVFIVTCQEKEGWKGMDHETSDIVPDRPAGQQASAELVDGLILYMHKGCTRDGQGSGALPGAYAQASSEPVAPSTEAAKSALGGLEGAGGGGGGPG